MTLKLPSFLPFDAKQLWSGVDIIDPLSRLLFCPAHPPFLSLLSPSPGILPAKGPASDSSRGRSSSFSSRIQPHSRPAICCCYIFFLGPSQGHTFPPWSSLFQSLCGLFVPLHVGVWVRGP